MVPYKARARWLIGAILSLSVGFMATACSQKTATNAPPADTKKESTGIAEIASYEGSDRTDRLVAAAKKEGTVNLYTSIAQNDTEKIVSGFEKKYGVKVNVFRAATDEVLQRVVNESKAGKNNFDVVHISSTEMEALHREKLLQGVKSPYDEDLLPGSIPSHKEWAATILSVFVQAYNTDKVKKEELPKTYQDLLDSKWRGRLGIEAKDYEWFWTIIKNMGEDKGIQYFKDLVKTNGISVRKGHSLLNNMIISGEVPLGLTVYNYMPAQAKKNGAPIDWFAIEPAIARSNAVGVSKKSSHPNAAVLFYDYLLGDGQKLFVDMDYVPTNTKVESPMKNTKITIVDAATALDENEKWTNLFEDIIVKRK
jgi:iron(III) transport system substrate-binding protein